MRSQSPFAEVLPPTVAYEAIGDAVVPWRYSEPDAEYAALRTSAAVVDLDGCGLIAVDGPQADALLERVFTRDVEFLSPESSVMGLLLDDEARPVDLVTVFRSDTGFVIETSVGRGASTLAYLEEAGVGDAAINRVDDRTMFGFEGPAAWSVADELFDEPITGLPFQGVRHVTVDGVDATVSRTGVTGEFGFKVICSLEHAATIARKAARHARPIGHEALEVAMTEFRQPLLHREASDDDATVITSGLNWLVDLEKETFVGREALVRQREAGPSGLPVCFVTDLDAAPGAAIGADGEQLGRIVHSVRSPGVGGWCGMARVRPDCAASGLVFSLPAGTGTVRTVSAPIVIPTSWGALVSSLAGSEVEA